MKSTQLLVSKSDLCSAGELISATCSSRPSPISIENAESENRWVKVHMAMGQSKTTRKPHVFVFGSIYQGSILGTHFLPTAIYYIDFGDLQSRCGMGTLPRVSHAFTGKLTGHCPAPAPTGPMLCFSMWPLSMRLAWAKTEGPVCVVCFFFKQTHKSQTHVSCFEQLKRCSQPGASRFKPTTLLAKRHVPGAERPVRRSASWIAGRPSKCTLWIARLQLFSLCGLGPF